MRRRNVIVSSLVGLAAAVPLIAAAEPASAIPSCPTNTVCVYRDGGFSGGSYQWIAGDLDTNFGAATAITFQPSGGKVNDNISTLINNTSRIVIFCTDYNYRGTCTGFAPHKSFSSVPQNDAYSSMKFA